MFARVTSLDDTDPYAKAGIMIRASTDPSAADVILDVKPDGGIEFMTRSAAGGTTNFLGGATRSFPVQFYLVRTGGTINGYVIDGTQNTLIGSVSIDLPSGALIGLAVTMTRGCQVCTRGRIEKARAAGIGDDVLNALIGVVSAVNAGVASATAREGFRLADTPSPEPCGELCSPGGTTVP